jgi:hypothetical protein
MFTVLVLRPDARFVPVAFVLRGLPARPARVLSHALIALTMLAIWPDRHHLMAND